MPRSEPAREGHRVSARLEMDVGEDGPVNDQKAKRKARKAESIAVSTASRVVPLAAGYGLALVATPILVTSLGLAQFGVWALTGAVAQYGALLDLGVSRSVTRFTALHLARQEHAEADRVVSTAVALVLGIGLLLLTLALVLAGPFAALLGFGDVQGMRLILVASVVVLTFGQLVTVTTGAAFGREAQLVPNLVMSGCSVATTAGSTITALLTRELVPYAISVAVLSVLTFVVLATVVQLRIARAKVRRPSWRTLRALVSFGLKGQSALLAELTIFQLSKVFLGVVSGPASAGAYELGSRLALGFRTVGALFMGALLAPLTRAFSADGIERVAAETERYTTRVVALAIFPALVGVALAPSFLTLWLVQYQTLTLVVMTSLCVAFAANLFTSIQSVAAEAIGRPGLNARASILTALLSLLLGIPALLLVGPIGLVSTTAFSVVLGSFYAILLIQPALGSSPGRFFRMALGPLAIGALSCVVSRAATFWIGDGNRLEALGAVTLGGLVFSICYFGFGTWRGYLPWKIDRRFFKRATS